MPQQRERMVEKTPSSVSHTSSTSALPEHYGPPYRRQTKQSVVTRINCLCKIRHYIEKSGVGRMTFPAGRLMGRKNARRRQVLSQLDINDVVEKLRQE